MGFKCKSSYNIKRWGGGTLAGIWPSPAGLFSGSQTLETSTNSAQCWNSNLGPSDPPIVGPIFVILKGPDPQYLFQADLGPSW